MVSPTSLEPSDKAPATAALREHPAVKAWKELSRAHTEPEAIEVLKPKNKSVVYRLHGIGLDGRTMIAKRCSRETERIEHAAYKQILPRLGLPSLSYYGSVPDPHPDFAWAFIEDAGSEPYNAQNPAHQALLASWLAALHTAGARHGPGDLPMCGSDHYLERLRSARERIQRHASNPVLTRDELVLLDAVCSRLGFVESRWARLEAFCQGMPKTVVHGDLKEKNIRVALRGCGPALLVFDWECAGWGMPGPDLMKCADLVGYYELIREEWTALPFEDLERMRQTGTLFRALASMDWEASRLEFDNVERPIRNLRDSFVPLLTKAMQALGLR